MSSMVVHYSSLESQMEGADTLNGFDVLVSYNQDEINALLATRAKAIPGTTNLAPFVASYDGESSPL
jgi:hypothetical protein